MTKLYLLVRGNYLRLAGQSVLSVHIRIVEDYPMRRSQVGHAMKCRPGGLRTYGLPGLGVVWHIPLFSQPSFH